MLRDLSMIVPDMASRMPEFIVGEEAEHAATHHESDGLAPHHGPRG